ncbi:MAG: isochorismatase family protein [Candidatus Saccharimonadales bacterium]
MTHSKEVGYVTIGVDIQNDFCPGGSLAVPAGDEVIAPFNAVANETRERGGKVVFTRDWHPTATTHFDDWPVHCVQDTYGAAFHPDLKVDDTDIIISKGMGETENAYSGFDGVDAHGITLEDILETELAHHDKIIVQIGGLATDYCVKATVLDALQFKARSQKEVGVIALLGAMKAVNINPNDEHEALEVMRRAGAEFKEVR